MTAAYKTLCQVIDGVCTQCSQQREPGRAVNCPAKQTGQQVVSAAKTTVRVKSGAQLGDWLADKLEGLGVTKEYYLAFKKQYGLPPVCNCDARREWLNRFGEAFGDIAAKVFTTWKAK